MLKHLAILVLTLAVLPMQTYAQANPAKGAQESENPSSPVPKIAPDQTSCEHAKAYEEEHVNADVRIISTPQKDGYDIALFWANIALAFVGTVGIVVGICTLRILKRQTEATEDAAVAAKNGAEAALLQAKHTVKSERAWLTIAFSSQNLKQVPENGVMELFWEFKNTGSTPAILIEGKARFHVVLDDTLPEVPDYGEATQFNGRILAPQDFITLFDRWEILQNAKYVRFCLPTDSDKILLVYAFAYVRYRNVFGDVCESRSCECTFVNSREFRGGYHFAYDIPAGYTKST
jgi:hypothetical protein